jgi:hypothetical protein
MIIRGRSVLALALALALLTTGTETAAAPANGDFEADPNVDWRRAGPGAPRATPGDQPHVARTGIGRFARLGDRDGRGAHGETPTHFFQRFPCDGDGGSCRVAFRFRSSLKRNEVAWVRLSAAGLERYWLLPGTGGEWKGPVGLEAGDCGADLVIDFGMLSRNGSPLAGTLDVDDVTSACGGPEPGLTVPPAPELAGLVPALPADPRAEGVPLPLVVPRGPSGPGVAALVAAGLFVTLFLLFVLKKSREPGPKGA